jgi:hypothetical protein
VSLVQICTHRGSHPPEPPRLGIGKSNVGRGIKCDAAPHELVVCPSRKSNLQAHAFCAPKTAARPTPAPLPPSTTTPDPCAGAVDRKCVMSVLSWIIEPIEFRDPKGSHSCPHPPREATCFRARNRCHNNALGAPLRGRPGGFFTYSQDSPTYSQNCRNTATFRRKWLTRLAG